MNENDIIIQDTGNDVYEFIEITNKGIGCYDGSGNLLIIKEPDPKTQVSTEYEVVVNKVTGFTNANNMTYPTSLAVLNLVSASADKTFEFYQGTPAKIWVITHPLNKRPSVVVTDSAGTTVEGQITYNSLSQITIEFSAAFSGYAELN